MNRLGTDYSGEILGTFGNHREIPVSKLKQLGRKPWGKSKTEATRGAGRPGGAGQTCSPALGLPPRHGLLAEQPVVDQPVTVHKEPEVVTVPLSGLDILLRGREDAVGGGPSLIALIKNQEH